MNFKNVVCSIIDLYKIWDLQIVKVNFQPFIK